jgi:signal peptide peptidase SppA
MSVDRYAHLVSFALQHPWAITPEMSRVIAGILGHRIAGHRADDETLQAAIASRKPLPQPTRGGVAVIPMYGVLAPRANMLTEASGGTSFEKLTAQLREAVSRDDVTTIVFDVDSPGGSVAGATEFATEVRAARARKPVIAVANYTMGSAAYWAMANATKIHAAPSAAVGSIGVYTIHNDLSEALAREGIKRTYIAEGKHKIAGNPDQPLDEHAHAALSAMVKDSYDRFVSDVAKGRGIAASAVRGGYGEGRMCHATEALDLGMVDKIATLDETLDRLLPGTSDARAALSVIPDTSQEPCEATDQDRRSVAARGQAALDAALFEMLIQ